ncbi:MAG: nucleotidyltransferase domain-containing protein [Oscillospiraceae bacterium]|jgi:predicted nucleotidyltransferase|nr:nucleotidyltransferase domain-containing protein [Oscillospiraceae bacterium]
MIEQEQNMTNAKVKKIADTISRCVPVEKIYLFGSHAYGKPGKGSDFDFFVVIPDGDMRPIEAMRQIHHALHPLNLDDPVDVLASYKSKFDEMKQYNTTLERTVDRRGVLLYERV